MGGYILGHSHKGRAFLPSIHGKFANILLIPIFTQLVLGIYLKLHIHEKSIRPYFVVAHGVIGKTYPILAWTQMLFGIIAFRGYCHRGALGQAPARRCLRHALTLLNSGQCLAHYIMGSGFVAYAIILTITLLVGEQWMRRSGKSPELFDSSVITIWVRPFEYQQYNFTKTLLFDKGIGELRDWDVVEYIDWSCSSQYLYRTPRGCLVCERHATHVRVFP